MTPDYHTRKATPAGQAFILFASLALAVTSVTAIDVVADPEVLWGEIKRLSTCARFLYGLPLWISTCVSRPLICLSYHASCHITSHTLPVSCSTKSYPAVLTVVAW